MKTTLNQIRECGPCGMNPREVPLTGFCKLREYLGEGFSPDAPISIATILDSNGLDDALWCLQAVKGRDREIRLFSVWCARQVQHLMTDQRSLDALDVTERFANGKASEVELDAARAAAWAAAWAAARNAARDAAWAAAWDAARAAARAAAWDAQAKRLRELCAECEAAEAQS